jgi:3-hydroxy acid dehydrogenase/malonic semialdehyde reductase
MQKTIFITGATGGFGTAFAHKFWHLKDADGRPHNFILHGRDKERLGKLIDNLPAQVETQDIYPMVADLTDMDDLQSALAKIPDEFSRIELLINNAGLALGTDPAHKSSLEDWHTMIDVNDKALVTITHHVMPQMIERNQGHIINIASTAGNYPYPGGNVYCASKAFVKQFSLALRGDTQGTNVRVTSLEPGVAETNFSVLRFKGDAEKAASVYDGMTPLSGEDVANAAHFIFTQPAHVNVNRMEIMPTAQSFGPHPISRKETK